MDLTGLTDDGFKILMETVITEANSVSGYTYVPVSVLRTPLQQYAIYAIGRERCSIVNELIKQSGLDITLLVNTSRTILTPSMNIGIWSKVYDYENSPHVLGMAVDIAVMKNGIRLPECYRYYKPIVEIFYRKAKEELRPVTWGGFWGFVDYPHFQLDIDTKTYRETHNLTFDNTPSYSQTISQIAKKVYEDSTGKYRIDIRRAKDNTVSFKVTNNTSIILSLEVANITKAKEIYRDLQKEYYGKIISDSILV